MQEIFSQQITVLKDCHKALKTIHWNASPKVDYFGKEDPFPSINSGGGGGGGDDGSPLSPRAVMSSSETALALQDAAMDRMASLIADMEQRREELASMEKLQNKTRSQLRELLDMKQQQSNIIEAKAAIRRADESVLQGRSIVVFTVVTIFFVSFLHEPVFACVGGFWRMHADVVFTSAAPVLLCQCFRHERP